MKGLESSAAEWNYYGVDCVKQNQLVNMPYDQ